MENILKKAARFCLENNHRFTGPRQKVLQIITLSNRPIKAYDILEKLGEFVSNPKPPTAYRAISFWHKHNFIHRIESLNAYSVCEADHVHKGFQFMICNDCGKVIESHFCELPKIFVKTTKSKMFTPEKWNLEINGTCNECS
ncbi:MAG: Fur family transcriptional regulator [Alphaproteobacteria bacterium]|mgnify:CR=1 FL=1|tara:strand:- start:329 stop:754 length:426 start_codon:yes stop_codon:yes gene_type:complete